MSKTWREHLVNTDEVESTEGLYIVFEEDSPKGKNYDLTKGVFDTYESAKEYAKLFEGDDEPVYIALYDEYMAGNYYYL